MEKQTQKSNIYRLEEMCDAMTASRNNAADVKKSLEDLTVIIKASDKAEKFQSFLKDETAQIKNMTEQIGELDYRIDKLKAVLDALDKHPDIAYVIDNLLIALGVFR